MINKSAINMTNTNRQEIAQNGLISFANFQRTGTSLGFSNNGAVIRNNGEYRGIVSITATPTDAGVVTAKLQLKGAIIQGATASATATAGGTVNLTIPFIFCHCDCCCSMQSDTILSVVNTGVAASIDNIILSMERIA